MEYELRQDGYYYDKEGKNLARIQWRIEQGVMHITHTIVDPSLQGQGVARKLLEKAVSYAKENKLQIHPICSYAARYLDEIPGGKELRAAE